MSADGDTLSASTGLTIYMRCLKTALRLFLHHSTAVVQHATACAQTRQNATALSYQKMRRDTARRSSRDVTPLAPIAVHRCNDLDIVETKHVTSERATNNGTYLHCMILNLGY